MVAEKSEVLTDSDQKLLLLHLVSYNKTVNDYCNIMQRNNAFDGMKPHACGCLCFSTILKANVVRQNPQ